MTRALVTNGIDSPGLLALAMAVSAVGLDVVVAAPAEQSSGSSAALTVVLEDSRTVVQRKSSLSYQAFRRTPLAPSPVHRPRRATGLV